MVAELISVGTELLMGNIVNTNAAYLSKELTAIGVSVYYQSTVGDNKERLKAAIETALQRADVIILSGGLGPTADDLTKETAAEALGKKMHLDERSMNRIREYFQRIHRKNITENNWKQAMIPEGATILDNHNGTAPGILMEEKGKTVILLPGPPNELKPMFEESVIPYLQKSNPKVLYSKMVKVCGIGESHAETMIKDLMDAQTNPTIAPYAKTGEVHFRVTAMADNEKAGKELVKPVVKELKRRFGDAVYTTKEEVTLEEKVVKILKKHGLTMVTAESCTGGMLASKLINVSGVSEVFKAGLVTYANEAKKQILGVRGKTLKKYGAVSQETAEEMMLGAVERYDADVAVSVTGIAGPDGGTPEKPVGLVYIGCYVCGEMAVYECHFTGTREKIRETTVIAALNLVRKMLLNLD
ncbi:MAG: competence/damage-inducible protein A [Lachnospiraceae bacterium]|nr:competence/damage-inducible protein A [Lachnospiraceae bacterium]